MRCVVTFQCERIVRIRPFAMSWYLKRIEWKLYSLGIPTHKSLSVTKQIAFMKFVGKRKQKRNNIRRNSICFSHQTSANTNHFHPAQKSNSGNWNAPQIYCTELSSVELKWRLFYSNSMELIRCGIQFEWRHFYGTLVVHFLLWMHKIIWYINSLNSHFVSFMDPACSPIWLMDINELSWMLHCTQTYFITWLQLHK